MLKSKAKLGEILLKEGLLSEDQLQQALLKQKELKKYLGDVLVELGYVTEQQIVTALGRQLNIQYIPITGQAIEAAKALNINKLVPEEFCRNHFVLPINKVGDALTVAFLDPFDLVTIDSIKKMVRMEIIPVITTKSELSSAFDYMFGESNLLKLAIEGSYDLGLAAEELKDEDIGLDTLIAKAQDAPVIKLVDLLIMQAIKDRASDIHVEPFKNKVSIRYRIDGVLYEIMPPAKQLYLPLISRIKILSKMDISEKRLPQDGGFSVKLEGKTVDLRVSVIPTIWGEKAVLRILDKTAVMLNLEDLGFKQKQLEDFIEAVQKPYGLVFLTGPTGSGKTTTLYAALNKIKSTEKAIFTIEDPVEYHLDGINQVQAKPQIGLTFAAGLRSFLRQDPDVILVGEVRDAETAEICLRAALTGHLVLSTLHTNDSAEAITRLIDIGIEPFLLVSTLNLIAGQRLVRKLCQRCKEEYTPSEAALKSFGLNAQQKLFRAKGCDDCKNTGYKGRFAIYEIMTATTEVKELIAKNASTMDIRNMSRKQGMKTLRESGLERVVEGKTSLEEILRVTA